MDWVKSSENKEYLINKRDEFILDIEKSLGPRDPLYSLGKVIFLELEQPQTSFSSDSNVVDIILTNKCKDSDNAELAEWQLMHESLHLIDPYEEGNKIDSDRKRKGTNVLEEALACWFQMKYNPSINFGNKGKYTYAWELVKDIDIEGCFWL